MTRTVAVSMCLNEIDVAGGMLAHLADEVDHILVADNGSTDGTRELLELLSQSLPLTVVDDPDPAYYQSRKISALAEKAGLELGADFIVPVDFDEIWTAEDRISVVLADLPERVVVAQADLFNYFATLADPPVDDPFRRLVWRQPERAPLRKVAFRWEQGAVVHQGNHGVSLPSGGNTVNVLSIRHFPYRSQAQFIQKARQGGAAYRATDLPYSEGAHWRQYADTLDNAGEEGLALVWREHFLYSSPIDSGLVHDPAPYMRWR